MTGPDEPASEGFAAGRTARLGSLPPWLWWWAAAAVAAPPIVWTTREPAALARASGAGVGLALACAGLFVLLTSPGSGPRQRGAAVWNRCAAAAVFLLCYSIYVSNGRAITTGDSLPSRATPVALLRGDGFDLSASVPAGLTDHYAVARVDDRLVSAFPVGTGVLAVPYFALRAASTGSKPDALVDDALAEKHFAALATAGAAALAFAALGLVSSGLPRLATALLVGLGTPLVTSNSQGLWTSTGELLLVFLALALLATGRESPARGLLAGGAFALAFGCRPTALLLAPLFAAILMERRRQRKPFAVAWVAVLATVVCFHLVAFGHPLGAYGRLNSAGFSFEPAGLLDGLAGVLVSPSRGAAVFFPVLLVALGAGFARLRSVEQKPILIGAGLTSVAILALTAAYSKWWGGFSLGPRLLVELAVPLGFALQGLPAPARGLRRLLVAAAAWQILASCALQHSEAAWSWNGRVFVDGNPEILWGVGNGQLAAALDRSWEFRDPRPYEPRPESTPSGRWVPIDLRPAFDVRSTTRPPAREGPSKDAGELVLGRLTDESAARLRRGHLKVEGPAAPNAVRVCGAERSPWIEARIENVTSLDTLLVWRRDAEAGPPGDDPVASVLLRFRNGRIERRRLVEGRDLFDTADLTPRWLPPPHRLYAGNGLAPDALVRQRFGISGKRRHLEAIQIEGLETSQGCLYLLAASGVIS